MNRGREGQDFALQAGMQALKFVFILMTLWFSFSGNAMATSTDSSVQGDCCVCQTGLGKTSVGFFKVGCAMWLGQQKNCGYEDIHSFGDYDLSKIPAKCDGKVLKIGYVGHWGTSDGTSYYVQKMLRELVQKRNMSVEYDNTACRAADNTEMVAKEAATYNLPPGKYLTLTAYQVNSVGLWDTVVPGRPNVWAKFDTRTGEVEYPTCDEYYFRGCYPKLAKQKGTMALCRDGQKSLRVLTCCEVNFKAKYKTRARGDDPVAQIIKRALWVNEPNCGSTIEQ